MKTLLSRWSIPFLTLSLAWFYLAGCSSIPSPAAAPSGSGVSQQTIPTYGGRKRVVIDKTDQVLRGYDGKKLVFQSRISTGKEGRRTPNGSFHAEMKTRMHHSSLYDNAPMPYSVQFSGNYFIHGYDIVPFYPASHGCIRLPLNDGRRDPAKLFYDWVKVGTPIRVTGHWQPEAPAT